MVGTNINSNAWQYLGSPHKNNIDLTEILESVNMSNGFTLVSFVVTALFARVPVLDSLSCLEEELDELPMPFNRNIIIELIKWCVVNYKFEFEGKYYARWQGMVRGNPFVSLIKQSVWNSLSLNC